MYDTEKKLSSPSKTLCTGNFRLQRRLPLLESAEQVPIQNPQICQRPGTHFSRIPLATHLDDLSRQSGKPPLDGRRPGRGRQGGGGGKEQRLF